MRSQLPTLELDAVFEAKEDLALAVKNALSETMTGYVTYLPRLIYPILIDLAPSTHHFLAFHLYSSHLLTCSDMATKSFKRSLPIWILISASRTP